MRAFVLLVLLSLTGCSAFDSMLTSATSGPSYDPSKIYLGNRMVTVNTRYADHYACAKGPMVCERFGTQMDCRCLDN